MSDESHKAYLDYLTNKTLEKIGVKKEPVDPMVFDKDSPYSNTKNLKQPMVFDVPTKSFEDKLYIVLLNIESNDSLFDGQFKICEGRTDCYRYIQHLIEAFGTDIDVYESKVITETKQTETETGNGKYYMINYEDSTSIYAFCKAVESYYTMSESDFSIDKYFPAPNAERKYDKHNDKLDAMAYAYAAQIEDPIIAQAAMDTFKERQIAIMNQKTNGIIEEKPSIPYKSSREEFPDLFNDGEMNV